MIRSRIGPWAPIVAWAVSLAAILLWPLTRSGYLLGHDMIFTPRQPLDLASIGLSSAAPRAVPVNALVALAERVVDGAVVGRVALLAPVLAAGLGAAALLGSRSLAGRLAACGFAVWNPFVIERLALGQWALLWAYAALPWLVLVIVRGHGPAGWCWRALALAAASITPTGGVIAAVTAVGVAGSRRSRRDTLQTAALALVLQLPWVVPALVSTASATSDPAAIRAFASRAEHSGGVLLTLLGGGGIWDAEVVPGSRSGVLPWFGLAVIAASLFAVPRLRELLGSRLFTVLAALAVLGLVLAVLSSVPGGDAVMRAAVDHVPGAGLLRDAQKWIMPLVLLEALLVGAAVDLLSTKIGATQWRAVVVVAALFVPLLLLPDGAATLRPTVEPAHYPHDWSRVVDATRGGDATVVPFGVYRTFGWAGNRKMVDPAPRLLRVSTVVDDRLAVGGEVLEGEDPRAAQIRAILRSGGDLGSGLREHGVRWVVVEHGTPGEVPDLRGLQSRYLGGDVSLYRVPGTVRSGPVAAGRVVAVVVADVIAIGVLFAMVVLTLWLRFRPDPSE